MSLKTLAPFAVMAVVAIAPPARAAADLERLLPANTDIVIVLDTNKLLNSPIVKQYAPDFVARYGYEGLLAATDGNPAAKKALKAKSADIKKLLKDRKEIEKLLATAGDLVTRVTVAGSVADAQPGVIIIEGKWSKDYVESFLTLMTLFAPEELSLHVGKDRKMFEISGGPGDEKMFLAVAGDGVLVMAMDEEDMNDLLDRAAGKKKPAARAAIRQLVKDMDPNNAISIFADVAEEGIKVSGGVKVTSEIQVQLVIDAGTAEKAMGLEQDLAAGIESLQDAIEDMAADNPALKVLATAMKRLKSTRTGGKITYELTLTSKDVDTLVKAALTDDE